MKDKQLKIKPCLACGQSINPNSEQVRKGDNGEHLTAECPNCGHWQVVLDVK